MAIEKEQHKSEIENIISRLTAAGVQVDEKEKQEIEHKFIQLVDYRVQPAEAIRTVTLGILKKHGIETKYWGWREGTSCHSRGGSSPAALSRLTISISCLSVCVAYNAFIIPFKTIIRSF